MIIVDFDKTITKSDSIFMLYRVAYRYFGIRFRFLGYLYFFFYALLNKLNIITNAQFKNVIFKKIFANRLEVEVKQFFKVAACQQSHINNLNVSGFLLLKLGPNVAQKVIIVTASPEIYVSYLLPQYKVIGTRFLFVDGQFNSVLTNCHAGNKVELLYKSGIFKWDIAFSDNMSDINLLKLSKECGYLVSGRQGVRIVK